MRREVITADGAPAAVGPYSHAVRAGDLLFCSGQIPLDPATGELVGDTAGEQARRCLENLRLVCAAAGGSLERAVRCTVYLADMAEMAAVNAIYAEFFAGAEGLPARVGFAVAGLPRGARVEIDAIVALG